MAKISKITKPTQKSTTNQKTKNKVRKLKSGNSALGKESKAITVFSKNEKKGNQLKNTTVGIGMPINNETFEKLKKEATKPD